MVSFLILSETPDYSDLVDILRPSTEELDDYGEVARRFIALCSFDKRECYPE